MKITITIIEPDEYDVEWDGIEDNQQVADLLLIVADDIGQHSSKVYRAMMESSKARLH